MNEDGYIICDKCNGSGIADLTNEPITYDKKGNAVYNYRCKKCMGEGKITWLENIFGSNSEKRLKKAINTLCGIKDDE